MRLRCKWGNSTNSYNFAVAWSCCIRAWARNCSRLANSEALHFAATLFYPGTLGWHTMGQIASELKGMLFGKGDQVCSEVDKIPSVKTGCTIMNWKKFCPDAKCSNIPNEHFWWDLILDWALRWTTVGFVWMDVPDDVVATSEKEGIFQGSICQTITRTQRQLQQTKSVKKCSKVTYSKSSQSSRTYLQDNLEEAHFSLST